MFKQIKNYNRHKLARVYRMLRKNKMLQNAVTKYPKLFLFMKKYGKKLLNNRISIPENNIGLNDLENKIFQHKSLLNDNKVYWYEAESTSSYKRDDQDPRIVAIYLPQFHPFKENDQAWGKGFTEWTNVTSSFAKFVGQQQPVLPRDLGFYDLRLPLIIKQQIELAKKYGIYGFQFYYYWFSGQKVMDIPINTILANQDWDFHFSICWANENWTRKWDGGDNEIIFEQKDLEEDPLNFIKEVSPILNDSRYICENGKPMLTVYRVELLNNPERYVKIWRKYFKDEFNKDLWLVGHSYKPEVNPVDCGFDATLDFTPIDSLQPSLKPWIDDRKYLTEKFRAQNKLLDQNWLGEIIDFRFIAIQEILNLENNQHTYKTISPSWSNEARRKGNGGYTFNNYSPELFSHWLDKIISYETKTKGIKSPIVYINAWNEWAESAMIEPSQHLGHNTLLRVAETLSVYSNNTVNKKKFPKYSLKMSNNAKLAVVVHLFYPEMWNDISTKLENISVDFDLYITVNETQRRPAIGNINQHHGETNIVAVPNRGRDVLPFIMVAQRLRAIGGYEYVLKLHTKKSKHRGDGNVWFKDVLNQLLPDNSRQLIRILSKKSTGLVGPSGHLVSLSRHMGGNKNNIKSLLYIMGYEYEDIIQDESKNPFIGSTMFWCRMDYLSPLLDAFLIPEDFQLEQGQIDGTTAHAVERVFGEIMHRIGNKKLYLVNYEGLVNEVKKEETYTDKYKFAE